MAHILFTLRTLIYISLLLLILLLFLLFKIEFIFFYRYGSYYLNSLLNIDTNYPGLKELLKDHGLSAQAQESYSLRTAIDQRGEQTINKDAKTSGILQVFFL